MAQVDVESQRAMSRDEMSKGHDALERAERLTQETQTRTLLLNEREADLQRREDHVALLEKQVALASQELSHQLTASGSSSEPVPSLSQEEPHESAG